MLTVTTYNVQNLYPAGSDFGPRTEQAYERKLDALADTVAALAPEVLALQEVGDPAVLTDLLGRVSARLDEPDDWQVRLSLHPDARGIRVAFACRTVPVTGTFHVDAFPAGTGPVRVADDAAVTTTAEAFAGDMGRGALGITVRVGDSAVHLVTAHLKSKLLTYPGGRFVPRTEDERARYGAFALYRRAAEAVAVRTAANGLLAQHPQGGRDVALIVLGDLNDTPSAATTGLLLGPPGSEIGTPGEDRPDKGDRTRLWNLAPLIPEDQRYSRIHRGRRELIDHILVSHVLLDEVVRVRTLPPTDDDAAAVGGPDLVSVSGDPAALRDHAGSDHAPVTAWLSVGA